jgi:hypothetical protein
LLDFVRSTPSDLLREYFSKFGIEGPAELDWNAPPAALVPTLIKMVREADEIDQSRIMNDADRISAMANEAGQSALFAVLMNDEALDQLPNGQARAMWVFLRSSAAFEHAEHVRYADDRRHGRMWDGFGCQEGCSVAREGEALVAFSQSLREHFGSRHVEVEVCDRLRPRLEEEDDQLVQIAIFREGRSGERKVFVDGRLDRLPDHPVIEATITYQPSTGATEVVAAARETREAMVRLFAQHLLGASFQGERLKVRQYTLDHLMRPFAFPRDPEDNIEDVKVTLLRLTPLDTRSERVTLECMRYAQRNIWQMADQRFGEQDPLQEGYSITQARFTIRFRAVPGARGGRTLPVTISLPNGCDLKDRTERERLVGEKYLRRWQMLRDI